MTFNEYVLANRLMGKTAQQTTQTTAKPSSAVSTAPADVKGAGGGPLGWLGQLAGKAVGGFQSAIKKSPFTQNYADWENNPEVRARLAERAHPSYTAGTISAPNQTQAAMPKMNAEVATMWAPMQRPPEPVQSSATPASKPSWAGSLVNSIGASLGNTLKGAQNKIGTAAGTLWGNTQVAYQDAQRAKTSPMDNNDSVHNAYTRRNVGLDKATDIVGSKPAGPTYPAQSR